MLMITRYRNNKPRKHVVPSRLEGLALLKTKRYKGCKAKFIDTPEDNIAYRSQNMKVNANDLYILHKDRPRQYKV